MIPGDKRSRVCENQFLADSNEGWLIYSWGPPPPNRYQSPIPRDCRASHPFQSLLSFPTGHSAGLQPVCPQGWLYGLGTQSPEMHGHFLFLFFSPFVFLVELVIPGKTGHLQLTWPAVPFPGTSSYCTQAHEDIAGCALVSRVGTAERLCTGK